MLSSSQSRRVEKRLNVLTQRAEPFLKWAGGKRWLAANYGHFFPEVFGTYYEPFLGSGSVFFHLRPVKAVLTDVNKSLINCYRSIKADPNYIANRLEYFHKNHTKEFYYNTRKNLTADSLDSAATFIYLNRVCWNGLYRVNRRGEFNVPIGTKTNVVRPFDNYKLAAEVLSNADISYADFEIIIEKSQSGDFLFVDPPYTVKHDNNGFVKYNENIFSWEDQIRLRKALDRASSRNVMVMITNANHSSITELYSGFGNINCISRNSVISGKSSGRSVATELLIRNFGQ